MGANSRLGAYSNKYGKYRATLIKCEEVMCSIQFVRTDTSIHVRIIMAQSIPSVPTPVPGHLSGICHLVGPGGGVLSENLFTGVGYLSILLEEVNVVPFSTSR